MEDLTIDKSGENECKYGKFAIVGDGRNAGNLMKQQMALLEELESYRAIGTVKKCREATEKQIEMDCLPPIESSFTYKGICPVCDNRILLSEQYCSKCGQKLGNVKKDVKIEEYAEANEFAQEFNLTAGKKYKVLEFNGDCIKVENDLGNEEWYSLDYFYERSKWRKNG